MLPAASCQSRRSRRGLPIWPAIVSSGKPGASRSHVNAATAATAHAERQRQEGRAEPERALEGGQDDGAEAAADRHGRLPDPEGEPALARREPRHDRASRGGVHGRARHAGQRHERYQPPELVGRGRRTEQQRGAAEPDGDHRSLPHAVGQQAPTEQRQRHTAGRRGERDAECPEADVELVGERRRQHREGE